jgi:RNA polymerase sigma-70 factor (ECF subfamily)
VLRVELLAIAEAILVAALQRDASTDSVPEIDWDSSLDEARTQIARCLAPMVEELAPEYGEALRLVEIEGLTQRAAAARVGISTSGMKSRVQRARRQLKGVLLECCDVTVDSRGSVTAFADRNGRCYACEDT